MSAVKLNKPNLLESVRNELNALSKLEALAKQGTPKDLDDAIKVALQLAWVSPACLNTMKATIKDRLAQDFSVVLMQNSQSVEGQKALTNLWNRLFPNDKRNF